MWFEVGRPATPVPRRAPGDRVAGGESIDITLLAVPLLMHWAWQEHAATLLRDYLLFALERDARALDDHAAASSALGVLDEQVPRPQLPSEPDALMASSVEPTVTAAAVALRLTTSSVHHFEVLDDLLVRARAAAEDGLLLSPPTQPEMAEMRAWLCGEVAGQAVAAPPRPWRARTDVRVAVRGGDDRPRAFHELAGLDEPLIAMDDTSVIVAVTTDVVELLGYRRESDLLGRRILAVVPLGSTRPTSPAPPCTRPTVETSCSTGGSPSRWCEPTAARSPWTCTWTHGAWTATSGPSWRACGCREQPPRKTCARRERSWRT